jgi:GT2 family glycosyltransferase
VSRPGGPPLPVSVVIPTYRREQVLIDTVRSVLQLDPPPQEVLVIDQTRSHETATEEALAGWDRQGKIHWIRLAEPSITRSMNIGLERAQADVVLFVDDDIIPGPRLLEAHAQTHAAGHCRVVAGQVLQPGEAAGTSEDFQFSSDKRSWVTEVMGCNFSVNRVLAIRLGGFDENFVRVAYRFEAEFCDRALAAGEKILFEPEASIRHLKAESGGTRSYGNHLTTVKPSHAVGAYYYLLRAASVRHRIAKVVARFFRSVRTRHHLRRPWWIPGTLAAELLGLFWAVRLFMKGPRLIGPFADLRQSHD